MEAAVMGAVLSTVLPAVVIPRMDQLTEERYGTDKSIPQMIMAGVSFLLMAVETWLKEIVSISGLLAVVSTACVLKIRSIPDVSSRLSEKFGKLWIAAEVILFVLVGAAVDIRYPLEAGLPALALGLPCGALVLSVAVLAILITAPLGALGMDFTYKKFLKKNGNTPA